MTDGLYIERDGVLLNVNLTPYESEDLLQGLLERHAALLAGDQLTPGSESRRFVLVRREAGIPAGVGGGDRWSVDHVFLDQDGVPTLVEVKRSTDTRIRREVVGQMLDYAANAVVYWPAERLREDFERSCGTHDGGPVAVLQEHLQLQGADTGDLDAKIEAWWQQVASNLAAGRVRLLFVADEIPVELRRIIEFLNEQMTPADVLGIEIRNYEGEGLRVLVPQVIGLTQAAAEHKRSATTSSPPIEEVWDSAAPAVLHARRKLDAWAESLGLRAWDEGKSRRYSWPGATKALILLYPADQYRTIYFSLSTLERSKAAELHEVLCKVTGLSPSLKEPGITCSSIVAHWEGVEAGFLTPLAQAARLQAATMQDSAG